MNAFYDFGVIWTFHPAYGHEIQDDDDACRHVASNKI